jgi:SAM-dependent methyltransferase
MSEEVSLRDFEAYFPYAPTALCVKECVRLAALRKHACRGPILDVGCGDGLFAKIAYGNEEVWGIDIDADEGRRAQASRAYQQLILADITRARIPQAFFQTCIANCSLEHVPDIDAALKNILGGLKPGGRAFLFVPNKDWAEHLWSVRAAERVGLRPLSVALRKSIDALFKHYHMHDEQGWREVAERAGFVIEEITPVGSTAATVAFEMFLLPSLAGLLNKKMTTRWTNFPNARRAMAPAVFAAVQATLEVIGDEERTAEFLVVVRRPG